MSDAPASTSAPAQSSNKLWLRYWDLVVGKPAAPSSGKATIDVGNDEDSKTQGGSTFSLSDFRIVFQVEMTTGAAPWKLTATVYNVPDNMAQKITAQYTDITLVAGYLIPPKPGDKAGAVGQGQVRGGAHLFSGSVVWFERGRESATDTFLRIYANCFNKGTNTSIVNTVLPAGHTQKDVVKACVDAMAQEPNSDGSKAKMGTITDLGDAKSPRARTLFGMPKDVLRDVAQSAGAYCHVDYGGNVNIIKEGDISPNPVVTLNSSTGMIDIPHQNVDGGIQVRSLLNPSIVPWSKVKINEKDITKKSVGSGTGVPADVRATQQQAWAVPPNGDYIVWSVTHSGDTRGNPWYTDIMTRAAVPTLSKVTD